MAWRFHQSFKLFPGVRINVSKSGISTTLGAGPLHLNIGTRGLTGTASVPGTGISVRQRLGPAPVSRGPGAGTGVPRPLAPAGGPLPPGGVPPTAWPVAPPAPAAGLTEIRSAGTQQLTSPGLAEFRRLLESATVQRRDIASRLAAARTAKGAAVRRYESWRSGFLFRRIWPGRFAKLEQRAADRTDEVAELEEQLRLSAVATEIEVPEQAQVAYSRLCDSFAAMAGARKIWDTVASRQTDQFRERTVAGQAISRHPVNFQLGSLDSITCRWRVPQMGNHNGGDLLLYPGFLVYLVSADTFATVDMREVRIELQDTRFHEVEAVPADAEVLGHTWTKANKDGSPDRRFKDNRQIPVCRYGYLQITSGTGLNEGYMVSNFAAAQRFKQDFAAFVADLDKV